MLSDNPYRTVKVPGGYVTMRGADYIGGLCTEPEADAMTGELNAAYRNGFTAATMDNTLCDATTGERVEPASLREALDYAEDELGRCQAAFEKYGHLGDAQMAASAREVARDALGMKPAGASHE